METSKVNGKRFSVSSVPLCSKNAPPQAIEIAEVYFQRSLLNG
jgi:hypothetical protein